MSEYGTCLVEGSALVFVFILPIIDCYHSHVRLAIKAYQVHKQIDKETALSGQSDSLTALKKKQRNIRLHRKLIVTLLVIILDLSPCCFHHCVLGRFLVDLQVYQQSMEYIIVPNTSIHLYMGCKFVSQ